MTRILAVTLNPSVDVSCDAERVQPTLKVRTSRQRHHPGGGGTNAARVIASLGGEPELAYLSGGATGALYEELLAGSGVRAHGFAMEGHVRIALMVHESETGFEYRFVPDGAQVGEAELAPLMAHVEAFDGDYLIASGSLPQGVAQDTFTAMAAVARRNDVRFVLDTSGAALQDTLGSASVFLVKPSFRELETYAGRSLDEAGARAVAAEIVDRGAAEHVVVSMGRSGALLVNGAGALRLPSIPVKTVSAVGAGDSFVGAMVWWLANGHPVDEAFRFGLAAGAAAAMTPGTELCRRDDVFALFEAHRSRPAPTRQ